MLLESKRVIQEGSTTAVPFSRVVENTFGHKPAAENACDSPKARPSCVAGQPEAGHADVVRYCVLIAIGQGLPDSPHGAAGPMREALIGPRGRNLAHQRVLAQLRVNPPGKSY